MVEPFVFRALYLREHGTNLTYTQQQKLRDWSNFERDTLHPEFKLHFPKMLRKIAEQDSDAIVFLDRKGRPFSWAARKLWPHITDKDMPKFYFLAPDKDDPTTTRQLIHKMSKVIGVSGKKVVLVDECACQNTSIEPVSHALRGNGAKVVLALYTTKHGAAHFLATRNEVISGDSEHHPPFSVPIPMGKGYTRPLSGKGDWYNLFADTKPIQNDDRNMKFMQTLRQGVGALVDEIIEEMKRVK